MIKSWIEIFQETISKYPKKVAVVHKEQSWTFSEIDHRARQIARFILDYSEIHCRPILVLLPKSKDVICSDIAIMYSNNAFSNLDTKTPKERLNKIIEALKPMGIIFDNSSLNLCDFPENIFLLNLDTDINEQIDEIKQIEVDSILETQIDTDPFCIINTSGSTGTPKGVVLNHKSFFDFMEWSLDTFNLSENDVLGSLSPAVFDIYDYELCLMMKKGATIVILDAGLAAFPIRLLEQLKFNKVTYIFWVPTIMVNIANMDLLSKVELTDLRTVWFAGEVFPTKQFNYWHNNLPKVTFTNLYGPIEITLDCTFYIVDRDFSDDQPLPIGRPCRNSDVFLLTDDNVLCKDGEEGEICVRGTSLAMGYYNNAEKTATAFVQNPLNSAYPELIYRTGDIACKNPDDGLIYFKGRKDSLIKHMGYRIELNEIEHVIVNQLKMTKNCCAIYDKGKKEIVLFYEKGIMGETEMRKQLSMYFPRYMIPTVWYEVEELPRNTNGKIDRLQLSCRVNK